jgi:hypothetical protein
MRKALSTVFAVIAFAMPVSAEQVAVTPRQDAHRVTQRQLPRANPYAKLFVTEDALKKALAEKTARLPAKSRVVCGMTVIEADPSIDPKIAATLPQDDKTRYTIRAVDPPICR